MPSFPSCPHCIVQEAATRDYHYSAAYVPIPLVYYRPPTMLQIFNNLRPLGYQIFVPATLTAFTLLNRKPLYVLWRGFLLAPLSIFPRLIYLSCWREVSYHILIPYLHNSPSLATPRFDCLYDHSQTPTIFILPLIIYWTAYPFEQHRLLVLHFR